MRKRRAALTCGGALACGAIGLALATAGSAQSGCTTQQCDQSSYDYYPEQTLPDGGQVPGGFLLDDTYFSQDINSDWLPFHGNTTIRIWFPPEVAGWTALLPVVGVGTAETPNSMGAQAEGGNYISGSGQLGILNVLHTYTEPTLVNGHCVGGGVDVTNTTCALYFAHIQVTFLPNDAGSETVDPLTCERIQTEAGAASDSAHAGALADAGTAGSD